MRKQLKKSIRKLRKKRRALLRRYDEEELHQLRIELRRLRGFLKQKTGKKACRLRCDLGKLADATSAARDWDTLVANAQRTIEPGDLALLQQCLQARQSDAHEPVLRMLQEAQWSPVIKKVDRYIRKHTGGDSARKRLEALSRSKERVATRASRARSTNDPRHWHKLRIACKDLRYMLDITPKDARGLDVATELQQCKRLQSHLGAWHDTVVHQAMVRQLQYSLSPELHSRASDALLEWSRELGIARQRYLESTKSELESTLDAWSKAEQHTGASSCPAERDSDRSGDDC
tara:strand:- start:4768 stop:5637 length:870 start_codon:yes stop_codon:yes gene_type:complete